MIGLQLAAFAIVALWLALRLRFESDKPGFLVRLLCVSVAAWVAEDTCIRAYGFYSYSTEWLGFVDHVPLAIVCIWPVVVLSALDGARAFLPNASAHKRALLVMVLVIADASLIEPIAVASGLWSWSEPGPFNVPIIGIIGWGFFALGAAYAVEKGRPLLTLFAGLVTTHALLLSTWWAFFKWVPRGESELPFVVGAWLASCALTVVVRKRRITVVRRDLLLRVPAASFFFVLLALYARDDVMLIAYALAFVPPYLALTAGAAKD